MGPYPDPRRQKLLTKTEKSAGCSHWSAGRFRITLAFFHGGLRVNKCFAVFYPNFLFVKIFSFCSSKICILILDPGSECTMYGCSRILSRIHLKSGSGSRFSEYGSTTPIVTITCLVLIGGTFLLRELCSVGFGSGKIPNF